MTVLGKCQGNLNSCGFALENGIVKSFYVNGKKYRKKIGVAACTEHCKFLTKNDQVRNINKIIKNCKKTFTLRGTKSLKVLFSLFYTSANKISREINDGEGVSKSEIIMFIKKNNITLRRVQRKKRNDKTERQPKIIRWHSLLREGLIKT